MRGFTLVLGIMLTIACIISGCVEEEQEEEPETTTNAVIDFRITDKVTEEFAHVNVTFSEVRLFYQDDDESYETIVSSPKTVDLVYLNLSQVNESLGVAEIEVGNYSKLWINVTDAIGVLAATNETVNITVPSGWLKIQQLHLFNLSKGNHSILVDIDLEGSIHTFHGGEEYKFIPVISQIEHRHEHKLQFKEKNENKIKKWVGNRKPAIDVVINDTVVKNKITLDANVEYEFNASGTLDLDGDDLNFTWNFGDNITGFGDVVNHTYSGDKPTYQLILTVSDQNYSAVWRVTVKMS